MCRKIDKCAYTIIELDEEIGGFVQDAKGWLAAQAQEYELTTLLAHADDGVIWGTLVEGQLSLSHTVFPQVSPDLEPTTLQQARLFGEQAELLVWRDGGGAWRGRLLRDDGTPGDHWRFDEPQLLWGDHPEGEPVGDFALVAEGQEGRRHAVPVPEGGIPFDGPGYHPLRLGVRHYLAADDGHGMLSIAHSRLTGLWAEGKEGGANG